MVWTWWHTSAHYMQDKFIIMLHDDIRNLYGNIFWLHVGINYLTCRGRGMPSEVNLKPEGELRYTSVLVKDPWQSVHLSNVT